MVSKNILYKKQMLRKKMTTLIIYGIMFLISTIAFYFVNTSKASDVLKLETFIVDSSADIASTSYTLKVEEGEDKENYVSNLPVAQNGYLVNKYKVISKEKYDELDEKNKEKVKAQNANITIIELDKNKEDKEEEEVKETSAAVEEIENQDIKQEENEEGIFTKEKEFTPGQKFELTKEDIENKEIYLLAEYDKKEVNGVELYNKVTSSSTEKNKVIVSGYMPQNAKVKMTELKVEDVQEKINKMGGEEIKLAQAYDIKIVDGEKEYEPYEFDENVEVLITGIEKKNINVWHIADDETIEKITLKTNSFLKKFETDEFSIYGIEELEDDEEIEIIPVINSDSEEFNIEDIEQDDTLINIDDYSDLNEAIKAQEEKLNAKAKVRAAGILRAPASTAADATLVIDDYTSDYNYYIGKNYTDDITGTYSSNPYTDSNLTRVTVNYHGFASGETNAEMKGRISLTETQDIVQNIRCLPRVNGNISIELMDNPFMDKPTGYGFGGWKYNGTIVTKDTHTKTQTLTVSASGDITIDLYADWQAATVVYVNGETGDDSGYYDGLSEEEPFGSWGKAIEYIRNHNKGDRETNIIVVTGDIDASINSTTPLNRVSRQPGTVTYTQVTTPTNNQQYVITPANATTTALSASSAGYGTEALSTTSEPTDSAKWRVGVNGSNYTFYNMETGQYLGMSTSSYTLRMQTNSFTWTHTNGRFYYRRNSRNYYFLNYSNGNLSVYRSTNSTSTTSSQFRFYTYTFTPDPNAEPIISFEKGSISANSNYSSTSASAPLTVTSLYNHTDFRSNATIDLTVDATYNDFTIYQDFQMNHVAISARGYESNTAGTDFDASYSWLIGRMNNIRLRKGNSKCKYQYRCVYI